nr:hypothetical protein [Nanoarchaeum sp.]
MKNFVRKIAAVSAGVVMLGTTLGAAVAADLEDLPGPMIDSGSYVNTAMVIGSTEDSAARTTLKTYFDGLVTETDISGGEGVSEDEVGLDNDIVTGSITVGLSDNKIPGLMDDTITWDNGSGSDSYNVHEEINITDGEMRLKTTYTDNKLNEELGSNAVIINGPGDLAYYYVFEETFGDCAAVADSDSDTLSLTILGKDYEVSSCDDDSITVTLAAKRSMSIGEAYTDPETGKVVTLNDVFEDSIEIDVAGEVEVVDDNATEKINGVRIKVESVGYHSTTPETSKAVLRIGEDITKTYDDGDEFVGEDEDDPQWTWAISHPLEASGYVGVEYAWSSSGATSDHPPIGEGESYVFPNSFAAVKFDKLSDVTYEDITFDFVDLDLYPATDTSTPSTSSAKVLRIVAENDESLVTINGSRESDTAYLYYDYSPTTPWTTQLGVYYKDLDEDYTPANKARLAGNFSFNSSGTGGGSVHKIMTFDIGDTDIQVDYESGFASYGFLLLNDTKNVTRIALGGSTTPSGTAGAFEYFGTTTDADDTTDLSVSNSAGTGNSSIAGNDYDTLLPWGVIVNQPEDGLDSDYVTISIPDDQVYAEVSVLAEVSGGMAEADLITASEDTADYDNLVLVGGPCVNSVTAEFMGLTFPACEAASGIAQDKAIIQMVELDGQTALIVAGWEKADTQRAATEVAAGDLTGEDMIV